MFRLARAHLCNQVVAGRGSLEKLELTHEDSTRSYPSVPNSFQSAELRKSRKGREVTRDQTGDAGGNFLV